MKLTTEKPLIEELHDMISEHNTKNEKVFYYSAEEAKELCRIASQTNIPSGTFEIWWDNFKKK